MERKCSLQSYVTGTPGVGGWKAASKLRSTHPYRLTKQFSTPSITAGTENGPQNSLPELSTCLSEPLTFQNTGLVLLWRAPWKGTVTTALFFPVDCHYRGFPVTCSSAAHRLGDPGQVTALRPGVTHLFFFPDLESDARPTGHHLSPAHGEVGPQRGQSRERGGRVDGLRRRVGDLWLASS